MSLVDQVLEEILGHRGIIGPLIVFPSRQRLSKAAFRGRHNREI